MASSTWRAIGLVAAVVLIGGTIGFDQANAQVSNPPAQQADAKQKAAEKKAAKQTETKTDSGKSAPMSGFRPDPQTNY
jgi:hypothetical protein